MISAVVEANGPSTATHVRGWCEFLSLYLPPVSFYLPPSSTCAQTLTRQRQTSAKYIRTLFTRASRAPRSLDNDRRRCLFCLWFLSVSVPLTLILRVVFLHLEGLRRGAPFSRSFVRFLSFPFLPPVSFFFEVLPRTLHTYTNTCTYTIA